MSLGMLNYIISVKYNIVFKRKKKNFVDLNEKRRQDKKGRGLRFLAGCTQGVRVIQMRTVCNRGGGGG